MKTYIVHYKFITGNGSSHARSFDSLKMVTAIWKHRVNRLNKTHPGSNCYVEILEQTSFKGWKVIRTSKINILKDTQLWINILSSLQLQLSEQT